jgi:hypothetical protein
VAPTAARPARRAPSGAADPRHNWRAGHRQQHARRLPGRQCAGSGAVRAAVRQPRAAAQQRARFTFLDPAAQEFFVDWEKTAKDVVASLRSQAGANPYDRELSDLVGELSTRSEPFRKWWAAHNVRYHQTGSKRLQHPVVGELELSYEVMELTADSGLRLAVVTAAPGSRSAEALGLLASWAATPERDHTSDAAQRP